MVLVKVFVVLALIVTISFFILSECKLHKGSVWPQYARSVEFVNVGTSASLDSIPIRLFVHHIKICKRYWIWKVCSTLTFNVLEKFERNYLLEILIKVFCAITKRSI